MFRWGISIEFYFFLQEDEGTVIDCLFVENIEIQLSAGGSYGELEYLMKCQFIFSSLWNLYAEN